jgi:hypothetical protein
MKTQTTFDDLVLEFPALDEKQGRALKGGGGYVETYTYQSPWGDGTKYFYYSGGGWIGGIMNNTTGGSSDSSAGAWDTQAWYNDVHHLNYSRLPKGDGTDKQSTPSFCVYKTMEVVDEYFGGGIQETAFALKYALIAGNMNVVSNGFSGYYNDLKNFANQSFHTNPLGETSNLSGAKNALANGHPVMAMMRHDTLNAHEVLIVQSFDSSSVLTYFDPLVGRYLEAEASKFEWMIEIIGKK